MSRINTNIPALTAQHDLARAQKSLTTSLRRLSSGIRINSASEDPAGLIISELLRSEIVSIGRAISNTQRAVNIVATTEGALNEVNSLLVDIRDKLVGAASTGALSEEEINANQLQIDSAVRSIARIANSTSFGGRTLLNGNLDYVYSGIDGSNVAAVTVYAAQFANASSIKVIVDVTNTASAALIGYADSALGASGTTVEISGVKGSEVLVFGTSAQTSAMVFAVNAVSDVTGVSAALSGNALVLMSDDVGSDQFVAVNVLAGAFATTALRDSGADAAATVNGAAVEAQGNSLVVNQLTLQATVELDSGAAIGASTFYIAGGGALFQIGQNVNFGGQYNIGIQSANPAHLGRAGIGWLNQVATGGTYSLENGGAGTATLIVDEAILAVSTLRGRLGALQRNTFESNIASLRVALENVTAAESDIRDTDFARETAALTRAEILVQAGTAILQTANTIPQNVLALLGR